MYKCFIYETISENRTGGQGEDVFEQGMSRQGSSYGDPAIHVASTSALIEPGEMGAEPGESIVTFAGALPLTGWPLRSNLDVIRTYLRGVARARRLPRFIAWKFVESCLKLLTKSGEESGFLRELSADLVAGIPPASSRHRQVMGRTIDSVLDDFGIEHDASRGTKRLPDSWDIPDTGDEKVKEAAEEVHWALDMIDPELAEMVRMHHLEGYTLSEIGERYGLSKAKVSHKMIAARSALVDLIRDSRASEEDWRECEAPASS